MNKNKIIPLLIVLTVIFTILGATFAYWSWTSDNANKTNITFTIGADFSCGANGGGNIASANLAPASCTNTMYALQREITTTITNSGSSPVSLDLWLTINSIGSGLSNSSNFRWALTTDSTTCSYNLVKSGTFQGKTANSTVTILSGDTATTSTYYLYIWIDSEETNPNVLNQPFSISLGGSCTNEQFPPFSGTIYRDSTGYVTIGNKVPMHHSFGAWCLVVPDDYFDSCETGVTFETETECQNYRIENDFSGLDCQQETIFPISYETSPENLSHLFYLKHVIVNDIATENYLEFVVTPSMVTAATSSYTANCNSSYTEMGYSNATECINDYHGATAGTYTMHGDNLYDFNVNCKQENIDPNTGDCMTSSYYNTNKATLLSAFGSSNCEDYSWGVNCYFSVFSASAEQSGYLGAGDDVAWCVNDPSGVSYCFS